MTEFALGEAAVLGLMAERGIVRLLGEAMRDPAEARGVPRAELYLVVDDADVFQRRALAAGAREIDGVRARDWGHRAGYVADPDGHVVAFASRLV
ncbi:MAG: glyoxalase [Deltaproteobacteria bacterium]|nr:glyoxalase [Deltaproteobacteria bacterium]